MVTVVTSPADPGDFGSILGSGRAPGERNGNPLQYACLGNPTDQRSLEGYSPWGHKRVRCDSVTNNKAQIKERGGGGGGGGGLDREHAAEKRAVKSTTGEQGAHRLL